MRGSSAPCQVGGQEPRENPPRPLSVTRPTPFLTPLGSSFEGVVLPPLEPQG
jgi:hypothetical protein